MNPQNGESPRDGLAARLRQQRVRARHLERALQTARARSPPAPHQPRHQRAAATRIDLQAGDRHRCAPGPQDHAPDAPAHQALHHRGRHQDVRLAHHRLGPHQHLSVASPTPATPSSTRWRSGWASTGSPTGRTSSGSGARPAWTCPTRPWARSPPMRGSASCSPRDIYPGETAQAGIGQGYDMVTPLQLISAYGALANGGTLYRPQIVRKLVNERARPSGHQTRGGAQAAHRRLPVAGHARRLPERARGPAHLQLRGRALGHRGQVRNGRVRRAGQPGAAAVPLLVRGLRPQGPQAQGGSTRNGFKAVGDERPSWCSSPSRMTRGPGQRGHRDREVLPAASLRDPEGLP